MQYILELYNTNWNYTIQLKLYNINENCANAKLYFTKKSIQYNEKGYDQKSHSVYTN